jgi:hypothetical protein
MINSILSLGLALLVLGTAQADSSPSVTSSIVPQLIDLPGTYQLVIPFETFQANQSHLEAYLNDEEVVFSGLITTRVKNVHIGPPVRYGSPFLVRTYSAEWDSVESQMEKEPVLFGVLGQFEARLVHGLRGAYCSLEISGKRQEGTAWVPFQEYYLVLALGLKEEQSLWLGPVNTPADAVGGMHIHFILVKTSD